MLAEQVNGIGNVVGGGATGGIAKIGTSVEEAGKKASAARGLFGGMATTLQDVGKVAAGFVVGSALAGITAGISNNITTAVNSFGDLARATFTLQSIIGGTTESSSQLLAVFERFGLDTTKTSTSLGIFSKHLAGIEDTTDGIVVTAKKFSEQMKELGVDFLSATGTALPMDTILKNLATKFQGMADGTDKTNLAIALFGRNGKELIPILNLGAEGLQEAEDAAKKYGLSLTSGNVKAVRDFGFAHRDLDEAIKGLTVTIGTAIIPALTRLAQVAAAGAQAFNTSVLPALKAIDPFAATLAVGLFVLVGALSAAAAVVLLLAPGFTALGLSFGGIAAGAVAAAPVILGVLAVLATHWTEARVVIAGALNAVADAIPAVITALTILFFPLILAGVVVVRLAQLFIQNFGLIRDTVAKDVTEIIGWLGQLLAGLGAALGPIAGSIGGALGGVAAQFAQGITSAVTGGQATLAGLSSPLQSGLRGAASGVAGFDPGDLIAQGRAAVDAMMAGTGADGGPAGGSGTWDENAAQLRLLNRQLDEAKDNLGAVRDAATAAGSAAHAAFRPFSQQIDQVDKRIASIQLGQMEKAYERMARRPINPNRPTSELPRLELEKKILEAKQTIATPFNQGGGGGSVARNPAVLAAKATVKAIQAQIDKMNEVKDLWTDNQAFMEKYYKSLDTMHLKHSWEGLASFAQSGLSEGRAFPSVSGNTTVTTTINAGAPTFGPITIHKDADAQQILDGIAKWWASIVSSNNAVYANAASPQLAGANKVGGMGY